MPTLGFVALLGTATACQHSFYDLDRAQQAHLQIEGKTGAEATDEPFFHITALEQTNDQQMVLRVKFINENRRTITGAVEDFDWSALLDVPECEVSWSVVEVNETGETPLRIVAVADYSGSMEDDVNELTWGVFGLSTQIRPADELALFAFDDDTHLVRGLEPGQFERRKLRKIMSQMGGGTHMYDAVEEGLTLFQPNPDSEQILILFSDGGDNDRSRDIRDAHEVADFARRRGVQIFSIGISSADPEALEDLAIHSGGDFHDVQSFYDLPAFFIDIIRTTLDYYEVTIDYKCPEGPNGETLTPGKVIVQTARHEEGGGIVYSDTRLLPQPAPPRKPVVEPPEEERKVAKPKPFDWDAISVEFEVDEATIVPTPHAQLDRLARDIKRMRAAGDLERVIIEGHTDSDGSVEDNQDLSQRRAQSVRRYLIDQGIDAKLLTARGYGEGKPRAPNDTDEGKALNRRVQFRPEPPPA